MNELPVHRTPLPQVDLGEEDPLYIRNVESGPPDRRRVSLRWLAGSVLTGLCSAALVGGSLQAAVGPDNLIVVRPTIAADSPGQLASNPATKGDRVRPLPPSEITRRTIQVSTVTRMADGDLVRVKPFIHVRTGLATAAADEVATPIPAFNPLEIFSDGAEPIEIASSDSIYGAEVDGEVTIKVTPLTADMVDAADASDQLSLVEIEQTVRAAAPYLNEGAIEVATMPYVDPARFETASLEPNALAATQVAIIPENVSFMEKSGSLDDDPVVDQREITIEQGDALTTILAENGVDPADAIQIQSALLANFTFDFRAGQTIKLSMSRGARGALNPVRMSLFADGTELATVARSDTGIFVAAEEPAAVDVATAEDAAAPSTPGRLPNTYTGIWQTALAMEVPRPLVENLIQIFAFDVDFQSRLTPADRIEIVYSGASEDDDQQEILFASIALAGETRNFYRFRNPEDGVVDYYDETGKSAKKFLMRKPMAAGRFRSPFGMRRHPILGRYKMHTGVDWAAPRGTPIMAAGNGVVSHADWKSGYGKHVKVRHANGYETQYSHMSGYAKSIKEGARVRQGQVLGYVGSTGLSTGPHLHYEVLVNKRFVDPMKIRLPRGRVLQGPALEAFLKERNRIDALLDIDGHARYADARN